MGSNSANYDSVQELRRSASEIASAGHYGWGNACTFAADEIERLVRED